MTEQAQDKATPRRFQGAAGEFRRALAGDISPDPDPQGPGTWGPEPEPEDPDPEALESATWPSPNTGPAEIPTAVQAEAELKRSDAGRGPAPRGSENLAAPNLPGIDQGGAFTPKTPQGGGQEGEGERIGIGLELEIGKGKKVMVYGGERRRRLAETWELKRFAKRQTGPIDPYPVKGGVSGRGRGRKEKTELEKIRGAILDIQQKKVDPRKLPGGFRTRIIQFFLEMQPDTSVGAVADLLGITKNSVREIRRKLIKDAVWEITDLDIKEVASGLNITKRTLQEMATAAKDYAAAWRMETDFIDKMAELGFITKVPRRAEATNFNIDLNREMEEFIRAYGIPSPAALVEILRGIGGARLAGRKAGGAIRLPEGRGAVVVEAETEEGDGEGEGPGGAIRPDVEEGEEAPGES